MIKANWEIFRVKFSGTLQDNFEWFCFLLFCKELKKPYGIFRYKNQSAIETNPVKQGKDIVGWQAKFYDATLSNHERDLIRTLEKAKEYYPGISKVIFYTNQEWVQNNKGKEPEGKKRVDGKASELHIQIEWRTASFFDCSFVSIENEVIARHFFSLDESIFNLLKNQQEHTKNILRDIQTNISFGGRNIEINRSDVFEKLEHKPQNVLILSGSGGVGKTAVIKNFYEQLDKNTPFYVFKATEFELRSIDELFLAFKCQDFIEAHKDESNKFIVIDSAEKLLELRNSDPVKEFLSVSLNSGWRLIFTTRSSYLEDLNYQFLEIHKVVPQNILISDLGLEELNSIFDQNKFLLPRDENLLDLIKNPFYLNEYLKFYKNDEEIDYLGFKARLWNQIVKKSKPVRERCFLQLAFERASKGQFFINPTTESKTFDELRFDGILGYESPHGYFITHDIYEEWALEKVIEAEFVKKICIRNFFKAIGKSLPVRRSFRIWVSEKLLLGDKEIKNCIEEVIEDEEIEAFWKDEILISVLLSKYSEAFFRMFKNRLLVKNQALLVKISFLLRITCKEIDEDLFRQLGVKNFDPFSLKYTFTKPKGQGWHSLISFTFNHLEVIGIKNINFIFPIIHEWNKKFKSGETTRFSALIALQYYQWIISEETYIRRGRAEGDLLEIILDGSSEIKVELERIFDEVLEKKWKYHRDPYYRLSKEILTKGILTKVVKNAPSHVLRLADLFWSYSPRERYSYRTGVEKYFGMEDGRGDYFPESPYQTPIYYLLEYSLSETVDFILQFTNKVVECFAKSDLGKREVEEVEVFIDEDNLSKQYVCNRLWCMYRGTQVAPHALGSIHMALEKFFLEQAKNGNSEVIESWLLYLLKETKSASISAVVTSIVLAYPEKMFNVAKILFKTKEFFHYDMVRTTLDQTQKNSLLTFRNNSGSKPMRQLYEDERIQACDDKHRKFSLENQFLIYQVFASDKIREEEVKDRQKALWKILDDYYEGLPEESKQTAEDKTWRITLARMDRRKMNPTAKEINGDLEIEWNPQLEPKLNKYREEAIQRSSNPVKHLRLKMWSLYKLKNDEKHREYQEYENNPKSALKETKKILKKLRTKRDDSQFLNHSIPADVCSVLIRNYSKNLSKSERTFCKDIIIEYACQFLLPNYTYQMLDGTQSTISVLPYLFQEFPNDREKIKVILLLSLLNDNSVEIEFGGFNSFSVSAIHKLWEINFEDAQSLLFGYLLLKPKYETLVKKLKQERYESNIRVLYENEILEKLMKDNEVDLSRLIENKLSLDDLAGIEHLDLQILTIVFQLIPVKTKSLDHKKIVKLVILAFFKKLLLRNEGDRVDYTIKRIFLKKLACFVLDSSKEEIQEYLQPIIDDFNNSESIADLFEEFIYAENHLVLYESFWYVWSLFEDKVIEVCKNGDDSWYTSKIIKSYLFALTQWKETTTEWHTLKSEDKRFFKRMSKKLRHCPSILYSISKLLNDVGSSYLDDGVDWVSGILEKNENLSNRELETNTIYYLENLARKYIYNNREKIKMVKSSKDQVLIILDFLIEKGSAVGYMLRESVL